ncbi:HlyC/CorC family transporter [Aliiroseovarius crassostreae]|uniref:HlyC/CorC family transporter n=1 Tax=Aliiroseovarius TaxID=1658781 RepID=UPI00156922E2|nr:MULTISPECIES: HlyC/CorC family transporter [Aliiroseovarius]NRP11782.1 Magnesium and cobalt efflux protein CorC [Aliiroseovarius sp. xm-d-517]NRP32109.1 Magnesium and cobalt efflux protein CorC [Aliiroseovarius sp. xm-m-314]NRP42701.1 Magnesium and cobalt efflux protein CorC [Aliiroseovarius sp. xm-m-339-2]NRP45888.1 Magnesium and cobalt efflux protein CorC [Aliiroseovarius sp. xm-m-378]NRP63613.1 Magnesium and cobalt efflux protein CorC [Aliiroseovarius sp. xm-a-151]
MLDTSFWITSAAILALLVLSGFFSGSETALTAASRGKLRSRADRGERGAQRALEITEDNERLIGSVLLGNNLVNILATSLATALFTRLFGDSGVALATLVMTFLVLIFAEVLPKTYAITRPEAAAGAASGPIAVVILIFSPIVAAVRAITRGVLNLFGVETDPDSQILAVREEIAGAITLGHSEGAVEKEDRDRLLGALDLGDRAVEEIMLHRSKIEMIDADAPALDVLEQILASPHTRLPVYRGEQENIIGVLHAKDLSRAMYAFQSSGKSLDDFDVMQVVMEPYFIPETTTLDDQMRQFLHRHTHFALVVDEYGSLEGLITLEDILEEIVGEITDEFDSADEEEITRTPDGHYLIDGAMTIRDLNRARDWQLPDDEANTIAGLVIHEAQMIPSEGQVFSFHGFRFEVLRRDGNRIAELKIRPL